MELTAKTVLPADVNGAVLVGRAWVPGRVAGPSPIAVRNSKAYDLARAVPTSSRLLNSSNPVRFVSDAIETGWAKPLGDISAIIENSSAHRRDPGRPYLLAPCDLQAVRACGVTFVASMLERVIEEFAKGDASRADEVRHTIGEEIGAGIRTVKPGSPEAMRLKESLIKRKLWSPYLEVGIGPDAEVFNKCQPLSAVGLGADIGIRADSSWNNPEPEAVLAINRAGKVVGVTLGNDVNLRDFEGRSALLLGKGKDNNASCAIGPLVRLFDENYGVNDMRRTQIEVEVTGTDGYRLTGHNDVSQISRDPLDLVAQAIDRSHQYPDGMVLFLGTQFAPTQDREEKGKGFTHKTGDVVSIRAERIGTLINTVKHCDKVAPWTFGVDDLMVNLAKRGLL